MLIHHNNWDLFHVLTNPAKSKHCYHVDLWFISSVLLSLLEGTPCCAFTGSEGFKSRELMQEEEDNCHAKVYPGLNLLHRHCISADHCSRGSRSSNNKWKAGKTSPLIVCLNITGKRSTSAMCSFSEKSRTSGSLLILARLQNDGNLKDCQGELGSKASVFYFFGKKTTYSVKKEKKPCSWVKYLSPKDIWDGFLKYSLRHFMMLVSEFFQVVFLELH